MEHKHMWDFYMSTSGTMVYVCEICGDVVPCSKLRARDSLSDIKGIKTEDGYKFVDKEEYSSLG